MRNPPVIFLSGDNVLWGTEVVKRKQLPKYAAFLCDLPPAQVPKEVRKWITDEVAWGLTFLEAHTACTFVFASSMRRWLKQDGFRSLLRECGVSCWERACITSSDFSNTYDAVEDYVRRDSALMKNPVVWFDSYPPAEKNGYQRGVPVIHVSAQQGSLNADHVYGFLRRLDARDPTLLCKL